MHCPPQHLVPWPCTGPLYDHLRRFSSSIALASCPRDKAKPAASAASSATAFVAVRALRTLRRNTARSLSPSPRAAGNTPLASFHAPPSWESSKGGSADQPPLKEKPQRQQPL
mmetsp:Transcript_3494/g.7450  ORF Transcript_3494/g.7450 Transcript_3494/m.7450 type:complete len:113 (-) Transcript_3494:383-721(-)